MTEGKAERKVERFTATLSAAMTVTANSASQAMRYAKEDGSEYVLVNHHDVDSVWEAMSYDELTHDTDGLRFEGHASDDFGDDDDDSPGGTETEGDVTCTFDVTFLAPDEETASLIAIGIPGRAEQIGRAAGSLQAKGIDFGIEDEGDLLAIAIMVGEEDVAAAIAAISEDAKLPASGSASEPGRIDVSLKCHDDLAETAIKIILEADEAYATHCLSHPSGISLRFDPETGEVGHAQTAIGISEATLARLMAVSSKRSEEKPVIVYADQRPGSATLRALEASHYREALARRERAASILVAEIGRP